MSDELIQSIRRDYFGLARINKYGQFDIGGDIKFRDVKAQADPSTIADFIPIIAQERSIERIGEGINQLSTAERPIAKALRGAEIGLEVLGLAADFVPGLKAGAVAIGALAPLAKNMFKFKSTVKSIKGEPVKALNAVRESTPSKPIDVFHSTGEDFTAFDPSKGVGGQMWFTSRKDLAEGGFDGSQSKGRLVHAQIDIRNPAGWDEYDKYGIDELMAKGYDGLKLESGDEISYAAFFPEQVRVVSNKATQSLPSDKASSMARAKDMGMRLDMPLWHGGAKGIKEFDLAKGGKTSGSPVGELGVSASTDIETAAEFAGRVPNNGGEVRQLVHRADNPVTIDLDGSELNNEIYATVKDAWDQGFDAIKFNNYTTPGGKKGKSFVMVKNTNQLRGIDAEFDFAKKNSANLLAGGAAAAIGINALLGDRKN